MTNVFISYAREDGTFASILQSRIRDRGFDAWMDTDRLYAGVQWRNEIEVAIRQAHVVVVVMSPDSRASEYVTYEWAFALGADIPVVPILCRDTPMHPKLVERQWLNFSRVDPEHHAEPIWNSLMDALARLADPHAPLIRNLAGGLHSADPANRKNSVDELAKLADLAHPAALRILAQAAAGSPLGDVRKAAGEALFSLKDKRALPCLLEIISAQDDRLWPGAAKAMARLVRAGAIGAEDDQVRDRLLATFVALGDRVHHLEDAHRERQLSHPDEAPYDWSDHYRRSHGREALDDLARAVGALGFVAGPRLAELIADGSINPTLRMAAIDALGRSTDVSRIGVLRILYAASRYGVSPERDDVRQASLIALARLGDKDLVPELLRVLHDRNSQVIDWNAGTAVLRALWLINTPELNEAADRYVESHLAGIRAAGDERELDMAEAYFDRLKDRD